MVPPYTLRPADTDDFPFAYELYQGLMRSLTEALLPWNEDGQRRVVQEAIASGEVAIVALDRRAIGWIQVREGEHEVELCQLYLEPAWHGHGVGTALLESLLARARASGRPVTLSVMQNNTKALALYERLGFTALEAEGRFKVRMRHMGGPQ